MVAVPLLSGSLLRVPLGLLSDRFGGKRVGIAHAGRSSSCRCRWAGMAGNSLPSLLAIGLLLGTAGASFAVALPLASRWYPPERQGLAMGVAAAGNSGTVITNLVAPRLADAHRLAQRARRWRCCRWRWCWSASRCWPRTARQRHGLPRPPAT